ncbi:hypothetical protein J2Z23_002986 [Lederbergia galactosidilyticus]|nr:hypothetical protein [Lederbergia galactosidilytica]
MVSPSISLTLLIGAEGGDSLGISVLVRQVRSRGSNML